MNEFSTQDRIYLRQFLRDRFNLEELKDLSFDIGVDYEDFSHTTKPDFVRGLIDHLENRKNIRALVELVIAQRPDEILVKILAKLPNPSGIEKVQIILSNAKILSKPDLKEKLADLLGISVNDVSLIATAVGSVKLLVSLPLEAITQLEQLDLPYRLENYEIIEVERFAVMSQPTRQTWRQIYTSTETVKWIGIGSVMTIGLTGLQILAWIGGGLLAIILLVGGGVAVWYQGRPDMTIINRCDTTLPIPVPDFARSWLGLPEEFGNGDSTSFPLLSGAGTYELAIDGQAAQIVLKLPRPLPIINLSEIPLGPEDQSEEFWLNGQLVEIPSTFELGRNEQVELSLCGQ
ncbi:MAG: hypothetical protein ACI9EW_003468 [Cellvibrionaceae bacterium]|jgi:hypothetical protein